uniref:Uncharacterized protein n=1 Tax=Dendroctonus ponderosae TaxID=77166 RepID=A0AAR5Q7J0_DENPD
MPQPVLTERPVILSKHKRNVIIHGRPLGPMGSLRSISRYVPQQTIKSNNRDLDSFGCERHAGTTSITTSLDDYQKCAQDNLITINNNLSNMLQETFSGIDCICQKVRLCLLEAKTISKIPPSGDLMKTLNVAEKEPDFEGQSMDINQDMTVADLIDETPSTKELTAETFSTQTGPTPFFTILNPKTESVESVRVELIESLTSKLGLARKCTADNFQKTMKKVDKIANYNNFLSSMVDDINKEINQSYSNYKQVEDPDSHDMHKSRTPKSSLLRRTSNKSRGELEEPPTNTVKEIQRVQTNFTEDQFSDNEWSKEDGLPRSSRNALRFCELFVSRHGWQKNYRIILTPNKLGIADSVKMNFTYADVYRKRAITDLHKRMLAQLEANDSLIFFQKMMKKNRKYVERNRASTTGGAPMMENGKRQKTGANHKYSLTDLGKLYQDSLWFKQRKCNTKRIKDQKKCDKKTTKRERLLPKTYSVRSASHLTGPKEALQSGGNHVPSGSTCKCKISVTNNQPLSKSDKCKIHWMRAKYSQLSHRRLKYLDILDDITKEDLMPLKPEYPRRDHMCKTIDVKDMYLYKLIHGKGQKNQQIWADLLKPTSGNSKANLMEGCHETSNTLKEQLNSDDTCQIARKLSKYIFANPETRLPHSKVFTVMPVHVFYNSRVGVSSKQPDQQQQKLTLIPMRESKEARKSEWAKEGKKLKTIKMMFDPIPKKIDKEIRMGTATKDSGSNSKRNTQPKPGPSIFWSPKNIHQTQEPPRASAGAQKHTCPSGITGRAPLVAELFKRTEPSDRTSIEVSDIKRKIQNDIEVRLKTEQERKIWENKYGKSVGQKLLSFIEKQPEAYQVPTPKHALPKSVKKSSTQQLMLDHLKNLKEKNDYIQTNIQKAIAVIENKMVDILGKPATSQSIEAFDVMEKEISSVLSMMIKPRTPENIRPNEKRLKVDEYVNDVDKISEELFKKLDRILESSGTTSSERSSKITLGRRQNRKAPLQQDKCKKSSDMNQVCFSSTSATGEEKITVTTISPKRASKITMLPPYLRNSEDLVSTNCAMKRLTTELKLNREQLDEATPIDEVEVSNQDASRKDTIVPIKEQVVNLALMKEFSAGDQSTETKTEETDAEETDYSVGDGDSLSQPKLQETRPTQKQWSEKTKNEENVCVLQQFEVLYQEAVLVEDVTDISEQFFTPCTSPLSGNRKIELMQTTPVNEKESGDVASQGPREYSIEQDPFYQNVNRIMSRVESVYNQLEEFDEVSQQRPSSSHGKVVIFQDPPKVEELEADSFLTPFMHAVKDLRKLTLPDESGPRQANQCPHRSPSYFNVLTFLDTLTDLKEERPIAVRTSRLELTAFLWHIPTTVHFTALEHHYTTGTNESEDVPKKKSGCLKNPSSHLNMSTSASKSRQKVSFLLQKEEKATQATVCAVHGPTRAQKMSSDISTQSIKVDEQVSAYSDAVDSESADRSCLNDDESTYQSTFEISDEISLKKNQQTSETFDHCENNNQDSKKNVVELFRNTGPEEQSTEKVKVFYDNYQKNHQSIETKLSSGFYNENCLIQVAESLSKNLSIKKRNSLQKVSTKTAFLKELALLEPLKNLNEFVDSHLLKKAIEKRHTTGIMNPKNLCRIQNSKLLAKRLEDENGRDNNEGLLKSIYAFVYLIMFTALNLEYTCI